MKFKKLLVLSMLPLFGTSAWADVPESTWTMPEPQGLEFTTFTDDGTHYYLYNPAAKMFFASGNSWNTQASVRTFGYAFWLEYSTEKDAPEGSYELWNYVDNADRNMHENHNLFTDDGGSTFVDHASQGNYSWTFTIVGDYVRFQNVALIADKPEYEGKYIGWVGTYEGDKNSSVLKMIAPDVEGTSVDWKAVTEDSYLAFTQDEEAYKAYTDGVDCFFAAQKLHGALVQADGLKANIAAGLAVFTNLSSTAAELTAATDALKPIIEARTALKKALDDAADAGFTNVAEYQAVFDNGDATKAEIEKAATDLSEAVVEWGKTHATLDNPADMTSFIKNPHFDNGDATTGWSGDAFGRGGTVSDGAEHYSKNYNTYQKIKGLTPGIYAVGVNAFYRSGNYKTDDGSTPAIDHWLANDEASKYAKLYGTVGENTREIAIANVLSGAQPEQYKVGDVEVILKDEDGNDVTAYAPNTMAAGDYYMHTLNQYANKLYVAVDESGELTIGVKKTSQIDGDWSFFDDFSLTYYGQGADACQLMLDEALKDYGELTIDEGTVYTEALLDAYKAALAGDKTATNQEEMNAVLNQIVGAYDDLLKNIELWKTYQKTCEESFEKYCKDEASYNPYICLTVGDLADYVDGDIKYVGDDELPGYETTLSEHKLNNEELQAEIDYVNGLCVKIDDEAKAGLQPGDDISSRFLKNPKFETGDFTGWNYKEGKVGNKNVECFQQVVDVWQEVNSLPQGVYSISVQAFERPGANGSFTGEEESKVYLYMNNAQVPVQNIVKGAIPESEAVPAPFDEEGHVIYGAEGSNCYLDQSGAASAWPYDYDQADAGYIPNSIDGARIAFEANRYWQHCYSLVGEDGKMKIGLTSNGKKIEWVLFANFKLTYWGYEVEYVQPALDEAMAGIDITKPMGKNVYNIAKGLADKAAEAKASGDGKTMFQMLADVYDASAAIISSVQLFATLTDAIENETTGLQAAIYTSANDNAKAEAEALVGTITSGMENHNINDDEVAGLLEQIANMKTKLAMPADWESATDDNSADFTGVIVNPAYDEGVSGWSGTGAAWSDSGLNAEIFGKDYDYYQDIIGLPAGTYEVTVQGFYRAGDASTDYNTWVETPDENNNAYLYAAYINGTDTLVSSVPLKRLAAEAESEADGAYLGDGYVYAKNPSEEGAGDGWIVPNSMTTASYEFDKEKYNNKVIVKLGSDNATLRIGLKKEVDLDRNWSIWDNWHINYFGKASSKEADGDAATAISTMEAAVAPVKVEFFTIDGRKAIRAQKGVILQKTTLSNGATIIKKIMK